MTWIKYNTETLVLISKHENEPTVEAGESKADVGDHYFAPGQSVENFKYEGGSIVERGDSEIEMSTHESDYYCAIQSELGLINQTTGFEPFFIREVIPNVENGVWTWEVPFDGDFELELCYRWSYNNTGTNFLCHILRDGEHYDFPLHIEPKDSSGGGENHPRVQNGQLLSPVNSGTDQFHLVSQKRLMQGLIGGETHTFKLEFACQAANQEATIYNAFICIRSVKNRNQ